MRNLIVAIALAASGLVGGTAQAAMPVTSITAPDAIVKVDYPCGRGWHLNRRGACVPYARAYRAPPRWHRPPPRWHRPPHRWDGPRHSHRPPPGYGYYRSY
jgi:hypothetical protein